MTDTETSWPPPPEGQNQAEAVPDDGAAEALHHGWRLLLLGALCAPPVFLPLAAWQGVTANRLRQGAGTALLLTVGGTGLFWIGATLLAVLYGK